MPPSSSSSFPPLPAPPAFTRYALFAECAKMALVCFQNTQTPRRAVRRRKLPERRAAGRQDAVETVRSL